MKPVRRITSFRRARANRCVTAGLVALAGVGTVGGVGGVGGCSNGRAADGLYGEDPRRTPALFSVAVTVMGETPADDKALQPARYIVSADGLMRAGVGRGVSAGDYPPIVRRLDDRQFAGLWALVDRSEILEDPDPARVGNPELEIAGPGEGVIVVWARAGERTRSARFELDGFDPETDRVEPLVRELARLAFVDR